MLVHDERLPSRCRLHRLDRLQIACVSLHSCTLTLLHERLQTSRWHGPLGSLWRWVVVPAVRSAGVWQGTNFPHVAHPSGVCTVGCREVASRGARQRCRKPRRYCTEGGNRAVRVAAWQCTGTKCTLWASMRGHGGGGSGGSDSVVAAADARPHCQSRSYTHTILVRRSATRWPDGAARAPAWLSLIHI